MHFVTDAVGGSLPEGRDEKLPMADDYGGPRWLILSEGMGGGFGTPSGERAAVSPAKVPVSFTKKYLSIVTLEDVRPTCCIYPPKKASSIMAALPTGIWSPQYGRPRRKAHSANHASRCFKLNVLGAKKHIIL